ncbi:MAG: alpha-glucan family phosphorylase [Planctomycetota bacterium]
MIFKNIFVYPRYPENLKKLYALANNLWATWNYEAIDLFYRIDPQLLRSVSHNPVKFLLNLPKEIIDRLSKDRGFLSELDRVWENFQDDMKYNKEPDKANDAAGGLSKNDLVAYFSMEFGLHECIPIYGGGLGILSGDFLKTASDLGMPVIGVGLIYKFGYFTQRINLEGFQEELFVEFENHFLPITEMRGPDGEKAYIEVNILGQPCRAKLWQIEVGQIKLILLDTDIEGNPPDLRDITNELYVADKDKRLQQELVLGFGGVKALQMLNIEPKIYHINEGHSAFLIIARLQKLMAERKLSFSEARALVRASTVFTTHTPVIAGNENFDTRLVKKYLEPEIKSLGLAFDEFAGFGFIEDAKNTFWLPALAIRFSNYINCVSKMHMDVSKKMWASVFPASPVIEVPFDYVTNGVHWSWVSETVTKLLKRHLGPDYIHCAGDGKLWNKLAEVPDDEFWKAHQTNKHNLIDFIRKKLADDLSVKGYSPLKIANLIRLFNPEYLTIVFARRFAHYKRATLLLKDKERLKKILSDPQKPVQLIFAGKAHPADAAGKHMIKEILDFAKENQLEDRVIFLENYDINVARHLISGADVWLNTPIRENEASGTSGMKAAMNGVLNLSVVDGWWAEGYNKNNGWAITAGEFYHQSELQDAVEANQLYDLLEEEITESFYDRDEAGIPKKWTAMMKESITSVCSKFNMNRVLLEYSSKLYTPAVSEINRLSENNFKQLKDSIAKEQEILKYWDAIGFKDFTTNLDKTERLTEGDKLSTQCTVDLNRAAEELFSVELFYKFDNLNNFKIVPLTLKDRKGNLARYEGTLEIEGYGLQDINIRIRPADKTIQDLHPELVKWKD